MTNDRKQISSSPKCHEQSRWHGLNCISTHSLGAFMCYKTMRRHTKEMQIKCNILSIIQIHEHSLWVGGKCKMSWRQRKWKININIIINNKTEEEERETENRGRTFWKTNRKNPTSFGTDKTVNNNYIKAIKLIFNREREGGKPVYNSIELLLLRN